MAGARIENNEIKGCLNAKDALRLGMTGKNGDNDTIEFLVTSCAQEHPVDKAQHNWWLEKVGHLGAGDTDLKQFFFVDSALSNLREQLVGRKVVWSDVDGGLLCLGCPPKDDPSHCGDGLRVQTHSFRDNDAKKKLRLREGVIQTARFAGTVTTAGTHLRPDGSVMMASENAFVIGQFVVSVERLLFAYEKVYLCIVLDNGVVCRMCDEHAFGRPGFLAVKAADDLYYPCKLDCQQPKE